MSGEQVVILEPRAEGDWGGNPCVINGFLHRTFMDPITSATPCSKMTIS